MENQSNITYQKRQTVPDTGHGNNFHIHISMYYALILAFKKNLSFKLQVENESHGDFDDLVIIEGNNITAMQLKHRKDDEFQHTLSHFVSKSGESKELMFYKYFDSLLPESNTKYSITETANYFKNLPPNESYYFFSNAHLPKEIFDCMEPGTDNFQDIFKSPRTPIQLFVRNSIIASIKKYSQKVDSQEYSQNIPKNQQIYSVYDFLYQTIEIKNYANAHVVEILKFIKKNLNLSKKKFRQEKK